VPGNAGACTSTALTLAAGARTIDIIVDAAKAARAARLAGAADTAGIVTYEGGGFSASELDAADEMARRGNSVVLRTADPKAGRMSDLLVNGTPYDVYTPEAGTSVRNVLSNTASKWTQVNGGGVVVDLRNTGLSASDFGNNPLVSVNGFVNSWGGRPLSDVTFMGGG
jgi:hypothetical protein